MTTRTIWLGILLPLSIVLFRETHGAAAWTCSGGVGARCGFSNSARLVASCSRQRVGASTVWYYSVTTRPFSTVLYSGDPTNSEPEWSDFEDLGFFSGQSSSKSRSSSSSSSNTPDGTQKSQPALTPYVPAPDDIVDSYRSNDPSASTQLPDSWAQLMTQQGTMDRTAIQVRRFSLGPDFILSNYVGNMGFDEVTDWEYYYPSEDEDSGMGDKTVVRQVVQPNPFDTSTYVCMCVCTCTLCEILVWWFSFSAVCKSRCLYCANVGAMLYLHYTGPVVLARAVDRWCESFGANG
jgi:hypothetical protein